MLTQIVFTVPGEILGKERPRVGRSASGAPVVFTPKRTLNAEKAIGWSCKAAMGAWPPFDGPVHVEIAFEIAWPVKWSAAQREMHKFAIARPDIDNSLKTILDALRRIAWRDDTQVAKLSVERGYSATPQAHVRIEQLEPRGRR
jgi:Holliday junction resolvase RusA-like endonuclease